MIFSKKEKVKPQKTVAQEMTEVTKMALIMRKRELRAQVYPTILSNIRQRAQTGEYSYFQQSGRAGLRTIDKPIIREILEEDGFSVLYDRYGLFIQWKEDNDAAG